MNDLDKLTRKALELHCKFNGSMDLNVLERALQNIFGYSSIELSIIRGDGVSDDYILLKVEHDIGNSTYRIDFYSGEDDIFFGNLIQLTSLALDDDGISKTINFILPYDSKGNILFESTLLKNKKDTKLVIKKANDNIIFDCYYGDKNNSHHYEIETDGLSLDMLNALSNQMEKIFLAIALVYESGRIDLVELFRQFVLSTLICPCRVRISTYIMRETDYGRIQKSFNDILVVQNGRLSFASGIFSVAGDSKYFSYDGIGKLLSVDDECFILDWENAEEVFIEPDSNSNRLLPLGKHLVRVRNRVREIANTINSQKDNFDDEKIRRFPFKYFP